MLGLDDDELGAGSAGLGWLECPHGLAGHDIPPAGPDRLNHTCRTALARSLAGRLQRDDGAPTSLAELAAAAEVSTTTLRHYFDDRNGVVRAVLETVRADSTEYLRDGTTAGGRPPERTFPDLLLGTVLAWRDHGLDRVLTGANSRRCPANAPGRRRWRSWRRCYWHCCTSTPSRAVRSVPSTSRAWRAATPNWSWPACARGDALPCQSGGQRLRPSARRHTSALMTALGSRTTRPGRHRQP